MDGMGDRAKRFRGADAAHVRDSLKECVHVLNSVPIKWKDVPDSARECETVYREDHGSLTPIFSAGVTHNQKTTCSCPRGLVLRHP